MNDIIINSTTIDIGSSLIFSKDIKTEVTAIKIQLDNEELTLHLSDIIDIKYEDGKISNTEYLHAKLEKYSDIKQVQLILQEHTWIATEYNPDIYHKTKYETFLINKLGLFLRFNYQNSVIQVIFSDSQNSIVDKVSIQLDNDENYISLSEYIAIIKMNYKPLKFEDITGKKHLFYDLANNEIECGVVIDFLEELNENIKLDNIQIFSTSKR